MGPRRINGTVSSMWPAKPMDGSPQKQSRRRQPWRRRVVWVGADHGIGTTFSVNKIFLSRAISCACVLRKWSWPYRKNLREYRHDAPIDANTGGLMADLLHQLRQPRLDASRARAKRLLNRLETRGATWWPRRLRPTDAPQPVESVRPMPSTSGVLSVLAIGKPPSPHPQHRLSAQAITPHVVMRTSRQSPPD